MPFLSPNSGRDNTHEDSVPENKKFSSSNDALEAELSDDDDFEDDFDDHNFRQETTSSNVTPAQEDEPEPTGGSSSVSKDSLVDGPTVETVAPESESSDVSGDDFSDDDLYKHMVHADDTEKESGKEKPKDIDVDNKRLLPFGSHVTKKRNRHLIRNSDLDARKDRNKRRTIAVYTTLGILGAIFATSLYNGLKPEHVVTEEEIGTVAQAYTGYTAFPKEQGEAIAKDFMRAYLNINSDPSAAKVLSYYYTGSLGDGSGMEAISSNSGSAESTAKRSANNTFTQKIISGPNVYDFNIVDDTTGAYTIGALVQPMSVNANGAKEVSSSGDKAPGAKYMFFNVNVHQDPTTKKFSIAPDSPTIVPDIGIGAQTDMQKAEKLGTGETNEALNTSVRSTVNGFIQGYAKSSPDNHDAIDQYVVSNPDDSLKDGLNDTVKLSDSSNAISFEAFPTEKGKNSPQVKVRASVIWEDKVDTGDNSSKNSDSKKKSSANNSDSTESKVEYTSRYVITLDRQSDGRYLVSKFVPEYYVATPAK